MTPAVFLDRDGTLIEEVGYLDRLDRLALFPWSVEAVRLLNRGGFLVVIVTNQAGVARGFFDEAFVDETFHHLAGRFAAAGARLDGHYFCPHHPDAPLERYRQQCECRKPRPGLVWQAARDHDIDLPNSYVVGDRWLDVELAQSVGAPGILVRTGYGEIEAGKVRPGIEPALVAANLMEAVAWILRRSS